MIPFLIVFSLVLVSELAVALLLTVIPRLGRVGKDIVEACTQAPVLDWLLSAIIWIPWLVCGLVAGWLGVGVALIAQITAMQIWCLVHESYHRQAKHHICIARFHNQRISWWRNNLALWATAIVVPVFFLIRAAEIFIYPTLIWLLGFPKYEHKDWVNVSRHKFEGLIGSDLIWCLYCDWMTGVYSLGAEMLRNVESFWCPIRFYNDKKCENCQIDFPDVANGWVNANGKMEDVEAVLQKMYGEENSSWFGHPERKEK
jgi:hypothetical protein